MTWIKSIGQFVAHLWNLLTGEAKKALPVVEAVVNALKAIDATNIPEEILDVIAGPAKGTAIEAAIKNALTAASTGLAKAANLAAETPEEALSSLVGLLTASDKPTKTLLLGGLASSLFTAVTNTAPVHAAVLTGLHYTGELQQVLSESQASTEPYTQEASKNGAEVPVPTQAEGPEQQSPNT